MSQKRLIIRNIFSNYLAQGVEIAVRFVLLGLFTLALNEDDLGLLILFLAIPNIAQITGYSLSKSTVRYVTVALTREDVPMQRTYASASFYGYLALALASGILILSCLPFLQSLMKIPNELLGEARIALIVVALGVACTFPFNGLQGACQAAQRFDMIAMARALVLFGQLIVLGTLHYLSGLTVSTILIVIFISRMIERLAWWRVAHREVPGLSFSWRNVTRQAIRSILAFSAITVIIDVSNIVAYEGYKFLLNAYLNLKLVAAYGIFAMIAGPIANMAFIASSVLMPVAGKSRELNQPKQLDLLLYFGTKLTMVIGAGLTGVLVTVLPWILELWTTSEIASRWAICAVLLASQIGRFAAITGVQMLGGVGKLKGTAIVNVSWVTLSTAGSLIYLMAVGQDLMGPIVIMCGCRLMGNLIIGYLSTREFLQRPASQYWYDAICKPVVAVALAAGLGFGMKQLFMLNWFVNIANPVVAALTSLCYIALLWLWVIPSHERALLLKR